MRITARRVFLFALASLAGCNSAAPQDLVNRAYIVSRDDDSAVTVIDLDKLEIVGRILTRSRTAHMLDLNADFTKAYLSSSDTDEVVTLDTRALVATGRIPVGAHAFPAHMSLTPGGRYVIQGNETGNTLSIIDTATDEEVKRLAGFYSPRFVRYDADGRYAYVANGTAYHLTRVDLATLAIDAEIPLEGFAVPTRTNDEEGGFADAQIDHNGVLWAAHAESGRVLVYDTRALRKIGELSGAARPWVVYAQHPFGSAIARHYMPNHGDATVSLIDKTTHAVIGTAAGDPESFGVNYSPLQPGLAFVMNRMNADISVVDTATREIVDRIPVGGTTEVGATTADGRYIVAAVSSANRVVIIDALMRKVIKTFDDVGNYPWSVTIPRGQNYCH